MQDWTGAKMTCVRTGEKNDATHGNFGKLFLEEPFISWKYPLADLLLDEAASLARSTCHRIY